MDASARHPFLRARRALAVPAAAAIAVVGMAAASPAPAGASGPVTTVLSGDVLAGLSSLAGVPAPGSTPMQVGLTLSDPGAAGLSAAYHDIYTPGSPHYHHFLSAAQVDSEFGVPAPTAAAVKSWATRDGLRPVFQSGDNSYLLLSGTTAQVEQTFAVTVDDYTDGGVSFYANTRGPTVPVQVNGVLGLNNFLRFHTFHNAPSASAPHGAAAPAPAGTSQDTCVGSECLGLTTPQDLWSVYDQPTNLSDAGADFGQGQQLAVLGEGAVAGPISDLRSFEKEFGLPQIPVTVKSVGDDFQDTSGSGEWDIDTQASTGMAPKAYGETLYFAKDLTDSSVLADISAWSGDPDGPMQANASFGECEEDPTSPVLGGAFNNGTNPTSPVLAGPAGTQFTQESEQALQEATLQGKTLFSSAGDTGSSCPVVTANVNGVGNEAFPETSYPASSRYAVAVGGTVLYTSPSTGSQPSPSQRAQETAWTFTGGGNTLYIPEPSYQQGIALLDDQDCVSQPDGAPYASPTPCRGVPDVAAQSGDVLTNGYATTMDGANDSAGGGTSLSSPLWMGMWARVQAVAPDTGNGYTFGFADETLYSIGKNTAQDPAAFFDIGGGPPSSPTTSNGYYASLPRTAGLDPSGWDYVSGLGAPDVIHIAEDASGQSSLTLTNDLAPPAAQDCGQHELPACSGGAAACPAGGPLWTNPAHTASDALGNKDPQLSLLAGNLSTTADGKSVVATLTVSDLSATVPLGATGASWYSVWQYKGTTYFAVAQLGPTGTVSYGDGTYTPTGGYSEANTDTGTFGSGPGGRITVTIPLANVGSPPLGSVLSQPGGKTYTDEGVPPSPLGGATGAQLAVDTGGPGCDFTVS